ncbi:MAG: hypothetical protein DMF49_07190 [Acidobacteria bacterium]|nr:MAG: hypothetical protein DMF49_07190 [Acidobacteriota bacterium]
MVLGLLPRRRRKRLETELREARSRLEELRRARDLEGRDLRLILRMAAKAMRDAASPPGGLASLEALAQRIEDCSRLLCPQPRLDRRPVALAGPLAEVIEEYRAIAGEQREILYIEDGGGDWLRASVDRSLFVRAMRELLDNSLRHAAGWQRIRVTSEPIPGAIVVKVRDDGCGMPVAEEDGSVVMAAAEGEGPAEGERGQSAEGIGLTLARRIVEAHGGVLSISTAAGHGTCVSTRWPTGEALREAEE